MNTKKKKKHINKLRVAFILFGITLPILHWLIFYVYANISSIGMAFTNEYGELSIQNFVRIFEELTMSTSKIREAFRNTFITFAVLVAMYPIKVLVSFFIYKKIPFYNFYRVVFFFPTIIFSVAVSMVFLQLIGTEGFIAQAVQEWCGLDYTPELLADSRFANKTIIFNMVWMSLPGDLVIWGGTFARIPEEVLESARIDGVNWWTEFTKIVVPLVWPTVALQMVLLFCGIFGASGSVFLLTGGNYGTMTITAWMYVTLYENSGGSYHSNVYNYLSAFGLVITVLAVAISLIIRKWTDKVFDEVEY